LGRALANEWGVPHADADDYFWEPTEPPFTTKRDRLARVDLMEAVFVPRSAWVLSGSLMGWGDRLIPSFDCVIFVTLEPSLRLARLRQREQSRYGPRIEPGGDLEEPFAHFIEWAARYDDPAFDGRSLISHERWLAEIRSPVLRLDGSMPTLDLVMSVLSGTDVTRR